MNAQKIGLVAVLAGFAALTIYTVLEHGYVGFFRQMLSNAATITASVDLIIALALVLAWMWRDARARGAILAPYLALTLLFGSVGPLLYLIRRPHAPSPSRPA